MKIFENVDGQGSVQNEYFKLICKIVIRKFIVTL
jgi:hypothetical protein